MAINDEPALEHEASAMGEKATSAVVEQSSKYLFDHASKTDAAANLSIQRVVKEIKRGKGKVGSYFINDEQPTPRTLLLALGKKLKRIKKSRWMKKIRRMRNHWSTSQLIISEARPSLIMSSMMWMR